MTDLPTVRSQSTEIVLLRAPAYEAIRYDVDDVDEYGELPPLTEITKAREEIQATMRPASRPALLAALGRLMAGFPNWTASAAGVDVYASDLGKFPADIALVVLDEIRHQPRDFPPTLGTIIDRCRELHGDLRSKPLRDLERAETELQRRLRVANEVLARCDAYEAQIASVLSGDRGAVGGFPEIGDFLRDHMPVNARSSWSAMLTTREPWIADLAGWIVIGFRIRTAAFLKPGAIDVGQVDDVLGAAAASDARDALRLVESQMFRGGQRPVRVEEISLRLHRLYADLWNSLRARRGRDELTVEEMMAEFGS